MLLKRYIVKIKWNWVEGHCFYKGGWETAALRLYLWDKTQHLGSPPAPSLQWIPCTVKPSVSPSGSGVTPGLSHPPVLHRPPVTADGPFGFLLTAKRRKEKEGTVGQVFNFFQQRVCITFGEGNGNPLQCSCLENPRDGGAWWAAVCGVAQSRTRPKWLSSSSVYHLYSYFLNFVIYLFSCTGLRCVAGAL